MIDATKIATAYIAAWNETDAARRSVLLAEAFTAGATYVDPLMAGGNREEISALIAVVQQRFPGFRFALRGRPDAFGSKLRFSWGLGPVAGDTLIEGTDFASVADGKIEAVTGFLDKVPVAA